MPIGFDPGGGGGGGGSVVAVRAGWEAVRQVVAPLAPWLDVAEEVGRWAWRQVVELELEPEHYEVWATANDERLCPECAPLGGLVWREGEGWYPPVHINCRCVRAYHHTEWRVRRVTQWELAWQMPNGLFA